MRTIELRIDWNGKDEKVGEIEFDQMGCDFEIKFSNQLYIEDFDLHQRGMYVYDAGEFCIQWDAVDNEDGDVASFYFDTEVIMSRNVYYIEKFHPAEFNPILAALNK